MPYKEDVSTPHVAVAQYLSDRGYEKEECSREYKWKKAKLSYYEAQAKAKGHNDWY